MYSLLKQAGACLAMVAAAHGRRHNVNGGGDGEKPIGPVDGGIAPNCDYYDTADAKDHTCDYFTSFWGISQADFIKWNPSVKSDCSGIVIGHSYCVDVKPAPTTTTPTPTTTSVTTPTPTQDGMVSNCNSFYRAVSGDACFKIAQKYNIDTNLFIQWNPAVGQDCSLLLVGDYYCVGIAGPTTTVGPTGAPTPSPTQDGIAPNCNAFYQAKSGDSCDKIATKYGTFSSDDFIKWNPAVGRDCTSLLAGYYYCVGVPGTPTSSGGNGTPTSSPKPSPTQDGLISSCKSFYKAQSGDSCSQIVDSYGTFTLDDFLKWNPAVGQDCTRLLAGYYYCVGIPGTPTSKPPGGSEPTGVPPNGVQTPSPTQPDIIDTCKNFHLVKSGESCTDIANKNGITVADLTTWNPKAGNGCTSIYANTWACIEPIRHFDFNDATNDRWETIDGTFDASSRALAGKGRSKARMKAGFNHVVFKVKVTVQDKGGNAGVLFRSSGHGSGTDAYRGYFAGISADGYITLGRSDYNSWHELKRTNLQINTGQQYTLAVQALADQLAVFVDEMNTPKITVSDGTYQVGSLGFRTYDTRASFDDVDISPVVFDNFDTNLVNWSIYNGGFDARTHEMVGADVDSGKIALQATFADFTLEGDVKFNHTGGNAGFIFRATGLGKGADTYHGYYAGLDSSGNVVLGRADNRWTQLDHNAVGIKTNQKYHLKVQAVGSSISISVDGKGYIQYNKDTTYKTGLTGVRVFKTGVNVDNFRVQKA